MVALRGSPSFGGAVMENWQSEFLQFSLFIAATIWLVQKGSNESKALGDAGLESDEQQQIGPHAPRGGARWAKADDFRTRIYENSLLIVMTLIFFATWFGQSLNNWRVFNAEQATHDAAPVSWGRYLSIPTSGRRPFRTGSRSFSPSARWWSSRSISVSADRPSPSPSVRRTTRRQHPAKGISDTESAAATRSRSFTRDAVVCPSLVRGACVWARSDRGISTFPATPSDAGTGERPSLAICPSRRPTPVRAIRARRGRPSCSRRTTPRSSASASVRASSDAIAVLDRQSDDSSLERE